MLDLSGLLPDSVTARVTVFTGLGHGPPGSLGILWRSAILIICTRCCRLRLERLLRRWLPVLDGAILLHRLDRRLLIGCLSGVPGLRYRCRIILPGLNRVSRCLSLRWCQHDLALLQIVRSWIPLPDMQYLLLRRIAAFLFFCGIDRFIITACIQNE